MKKKKTIAISLIMVMIVASIACNSTNYKYKEWRNAVLGQNSSKLKIEYAETESAINAEIYSYTRESSSECEEIVSKCNDYLMGNTEYSPDIIDVNLILKLKSDEVAIRFSNNTNSTEDQGTVFCYDFSDTDILNDGSLQYACVSYSVIANNSIFGKFNAGVIILDLETNAAQYCKEENLELSRYFDGYSSIVVSFNGEKLDDGVMQMAIKQNPGIDVYYSIDRQNVRKYR